MKLQALPVAAVIGCLAMAAPSGADEIPACGTSPEPICAPTAPKPAGARKCSGSSKFGGIFAYDIWVRRVTCASVKRSLRGKSLYSKRVLPGWRCKSVGVVYEGGTYRCTKGARRVQFSTGV